MPTVEIPATTILHNVPLNPKPGYFSHQPLLYNLKR
jgi:hypothetical protein